MRIKLTLESDCTQTIDINYNYALSSMIYNLIKQTNSEYSTFLHRKGYEINNKHYKLFTFSLLQPENYKIDGPNMNIQGKVTLYISSPVKEFLLSIMGSLTSYPELKINRGIFRVVNIEVIADPKFSRQMNFKCISPLTTSTAFLKDDLKLKKQDLYMEDRKFTENLRTNIISKYEILKGKKPEDTEFEVSFKRSEERRVGKECS